MKNEIGEYIRKEMPHLTEMADRIFDHPELAFHEYQAAKILEDYLENHGFSVQRGLGKFATAFRAEYRQGKDGIRIGLLCEYDALPKGHACGHHLQGPAIVGAAAAIKDLFQGFTYDLVVYGTPAEEGKGGKILLLQEGFLKDLDVALMMHGGPATQTDIKSMAKISASVKFHGKSSHAALNPENGRSALDALLLSCQGIEFLREHIRDDSRIQYIISNGGTAVNVVPDLAVGEFSLRSYDSSYLDELIRRFEQVVKGAAIMTETREEVIYHLRTEGKIPALCLNDLLMANAEYYGAPNRKPARERTGSTDFANVMHEIPGACIRIAFVREGTASHSQEFLDAGKSEEARNAIMYGSEILAASVYDLVSKKDLWEKVKKDYEERKQTARSSS
ncbi:M20 family metallopeptidase [Acidaminococcus massiliensis]|uniref:M20 family metallopeptidase n=1 Tax=Acidaminococcus massiliensis TaxID=1852375 RepID=UPI0026DA8082|nr:M20 family metallopeptidase [Acidaminococcus massiliensis]